MSTALALRLIASGAVSQADAEAALLSSLARRVPFVRALIDGGAIGEAALDQWLEQLGGIGLRQVVGMPELVNRLPPHFCRRMGVLPIGVDHAARIVELAAADPLDPHIAAEVAFHLGVPARVMRAPIAAIEEAIRRIELSAEAAAGRARRATPPFPHGAPESSNPPPPPPDPAPIPLVKRAGERSPDTLRLYKQTLRPGEGKGDLDDAQPSGPLSYDALPESQPIPLGAPKSWDPEAESAPPTTLRDSGRLREMGQQIAGETRGVGESGRLRDIASQITLEPPRPPARSSEPNLRELAEQLTNESAPRTLRDSQRLRDIAQQAARNTADPRESSPRSVRESQRLRDLLEPPPPIDRLRDSQMRLRDLAAQLPRDATPPAGIDLRAHAAPEPDAPLSAMVPADQAPPPGEPPTVSFPSLPPPSVMDQPGLLAADTEWSAPPPPPEPIPAAPSKKERRPSRFARPAIDIELPQPPSENRARRQRTTWDLPLAEAPPRGAARAAAAHPAEPSIRGADPPVDAGAASAPPGSVRHERGAGGAARGRVARRRRRGGAPRPPHGRPSNRHLRRAPRRLPRLGLQRGARGSGAPPHRVDPGRRSEPLRDGGRGGRVFRPGPIERGARGPARGAGARRLRRRGGRREGRGQARDGPLRGRPRRDETPHFAASSGARGRRRSVLVAPARGSPLSARCFISGHR